MALTSDEITTIQKEIVLGVDKEHSKIEMTPEASEMWDAIEDQTDATDAAVYDIPFEMPDVPTIHKVGGTRAGEPGERLGQVPRAEEGGARQEQRGENR